MGQRWLDGFSAEIEIYLLVGGNRYDVAQIGSGLLILRGDSILPAQTKATLVIIVDGVEERQEIHLCEEARSEEPVAYF